MRRMSYFILLSAALLLVAFSFLPIFVEAKTLTVCPTCNYPSIQEAIDAAQPGSTVLVKEGLYEESLRINKDLTLKGVDSKKVKVTGAEKDRSVLFIAPADITVRIEGLTFSMSKKPETTKKGKHHDLSGIRVSGEAKVTIVECSLVKNKNGLFVNPLAPEWFIESSGTASMTPPYPTPEVIVRETTVSNNSSQGMSLFSCKGTVRNSEVSGNSAGILILEVAQEMGVKDVQVSLSDNRIRDNGGPGIVSYAALGDVEGSNNTMEGNGADLVGNVSSDLRKPLREATEKKIVFTGEKYPTLQHAVDAALPKAKIVMVKGDYEGGITVTKELTIKARDDGEVTVRPRRGHIMSLVEGSNLHLEGIKLAAAGGGMGIYGGGTAKAWIENSIISGNSCGLWLIGSTRVKIVSSDISRNHWGLRLRQSSHVDIEKTTITKNQLVGIELDDLTRLRSPSLEIRNSTIKKNGQRGGILLKPALKSKAEAVIEGNDFVENKGYGVAVGAHSCSLSLDQLQFQGVVEGRDNHFQGNKKGSVCPTSIDFLMKKEGGKFSGK